MTFLKKLWPLLILLLLLSACGKKEIPNAKNWPVEEFSYTNQNGEKVSLEDLKGKVWVADFVFTNCKTICLPMTSNMVKLQNALKDEGMKNVELVSFSIDPTVDSPDVLTEYGKRFHADFSNWHFLTGYSQEEIESFAKESFKTLVKKPEGEDQVIHGTDFFLVDQEGKIIQNYNGAKDFPLEEIIKDIKILQNY